MLAVALVVGACSSSRQVSSTLDSSPTPGSDAGVVASPMAAGSNADAVVADSQFSEQKPAPRAAVSTASGSSSGSGSGAGATGGTGTDLSGPTALMSTVEQAKVVKTAVLHVEVGEGRFSRQFSEAATIAATFGGFVASSTSAAGDDESLDSGTLVIRVPAESFDKTRDALRKLGKVQREQLSGDDVGGQLADIDARLRNLRAQEEAIRALMAKAKDVNETLTVQNQLGTVRQQIEELSAQQARLNDQVAYSTVTLNLTEPGATINEPTPTGLAGAWRRALDGAEAVLGGTIVSLGYLLPLAVLLLAAGFVARAVWRMRWRGVPVAVRTSGSAGEDGT